MQRLPLSGGSGNIPVASPAVVTDLKCRIRCVHGMDGFDKEFGGVTLILHVPSRFRYGTEMKMSKDVVGPRE